MYYAVINGRTKGIFLNWSDCHKEVNLFRNPVFRKFNNFIAAKEYCLNNNVEPVIHNSRNTPLFPLNNSDI